MSCTSLNSNRCPDKILQVFNSRPRIPKQQTLLKTLREQVEKPERFFFGRYPGIIGIESEIERAPELSGVGDLIWRAVPDGSLKDAGIELLTIPIQGKAIDYALVMLEKHLQQAPNHYFNQRCSTHVHINVSNLSIEKMCEFYGLYILLEPYFFAYAAPERYHNSFCIPVAETGLSRGQFLHDSRQREYSKYLAFAYNHLHDFGTLELRQLDGTGDMTRLRRWIMMLQKLFIYTIENDVTAIVRDDIDGLDSRQLAEKVFNSVFKFIESPPQDRLDRSKWAANHFLSE